MKFAERIGYCFCMYLLLCLVAQSCLILCNSMNCSLPGSSCSWGFSRQEYWSGLPCPPPRHLPNPETEPRFPTLQVDFLSYEPWGKPCMYLLGSKLYPKYYTQTHTHTHTPTIPNSALEFSNNIIHASFWVSAAGEVMTNVILWKSKNLRRRSEKKGEKSN